MSENTAMVAILLIVFGSISTMFGVAVWGLFQFLAAIVNAFGGVCS